MRAIPVLLVGMLCATALAQSPPDKLPRNPRLDPKVFGERMAAHFADIPHGSNEIDVRVSMCVDLNGKVSNVRLVESGGVPALDEATLEILPETPFAPALDARGTPVAMCNPPYVLTVAWKPPGA